MLSLLVVAVGGIGLCLLVLVSSLVSALFHPSDDTTNSSGETPAGELCQWDPTAARPLDRHPT